MTQQEIVSIIQKNLPHERNSLFFWICEDKGTMYMMNKIIHRYVDDYEDRKDVLQNSLLAFYKFVVNGKIKEAEKWRAQLKTITRNKAIDALRKIKRSNPAKEKYAKEKISTDNIQQGTPQEDINRMVSELFENHFYPSLSATCVEIIRITRDRHISNKELAKILGIELQTAKNNKSRCMKKMRSLLSQSKAAQEIITLRLTQNHGN